MNNFQILLHFALYRQRYALFLSSVEKVQRTVEITPMPKAPPLYPVLSLSEDESSLLSICGNASVFPSRR